MVNNSYAMQFSMEALLNCYVREVAFPNKTAKFIPNPAMGYLMEIELWSQNQSIYCYVDHPSLKTNFRFLSLPSLSSKFSTSLNLKGLAVLLIRELSFIEKTVINEELLEQIMNSNECLEEIFSQEFKDRLSDESTTAFIESEQSLYVGHRFHPAPKSRLGFSSDDRSNYFPEHGGTFQWAAFSIPKEMLCEKYEKESLQHFILNEWMPDVDIPKDRAILPVHPWQAKFLRGKDAIQKMLGSGLLMDHGLAGLKLCATASVRTCFSPDLSYFVKGSLHARLTNCIRKNAYYELNTALFLNNTIQSISREFFIHYPQFHILSEPGYQTMTTYTESKLAGTSKTDIEEWFAILIRENIFKRTEPYVRPLLTGSLFSPHPSGIPFICKEINQLSLINGKSYLENALSWFDRYLDLLIEPILRLFTEYGIILEPHLQNVVVGVKDYLPHQIFYRDMEGTKVIGERWQESLLASLGEIEKRAVSYTEERGWDRVTYCLWVNHIYQAVFYLSNGDVMLEKSLWNMAAFKLNATRENIPSASKFIDEWLFNTTLPSKGNLLVRFRMLGDKDATYVPVSNPLSKTTVLQNPVKINPFLNLNGVSSEILS